MLDEFEVALTIPVGDGFLVFADFPPPGGYVMLHKVRPEILACQLTLLQQVGGCRQVTR